MVSPNVKDNEMTVAEWKEASIRESAAFMGWKPDDFGHVKIGPKFAGETKEGISPDDIILIARSHNRKPDVLGFGVVHGRYEMINKLKNFQLPKGDSDDGSLRRLLHFTRYDTLPTNILFQNFFNWPRSLVQLHPEKAGKQEKYNVHKKVCDWMEQNLGRAGDEQHVTTDSKVEQKLGVKSAVIVKPPEKHQPDYEYPSKSAQIKANQVEDELLRGYRNWLESKGHNLRAIKYNGRLQSDGYEKERQNLIEAKASASRENIRMAVGQLLDYAFLGMENNFGEPNKAMLLPTKPDLDLEKWLQHLHISIIWREGESFKDNASGQFS